MNDVPSLPERAPERFQFGLKHLLAFMLVSSFVALGIRLLVGIFAAVPAGYLPSWVNVILAILAIGGLGYFFLRVPFLAVSMGRVGTRWRAVRAHRHELAEWAKARHSGGRRIMEESDAEPSPGEPSPGEREASAP